MLRNPTEVGPGPSTRWGERLFGGGQVPDSRCLVHRNGVFMTPLGARWPLLQTVVAAPCANQAVEPFYGTRRADNLHIMLKNQQHQEY